MYGGKIFQEFFMFLMKGERGCRLELFMRECFERNCSAQNGSKASYKLEAYPYLRGTVPKSRVNAALLARGYSRVPCFDFQKSRFSMNLVMAIVMLLDIIANTLKIYMLRPQCLVSCVLLIRNFYLTFNQF